MCKWYFQSLLSFKQLQSSLGLNEMNLVVLLSELCSNRTPDRNVNKANSKLTTMLASTYSYLFLSFLLFSKGMTFMCNIRATVRRALLCCWIKADASGALRSTDPESHLIISHMLWQWMIFFSLRAFFVFMACYIIISDVTDVLHFKIPEELKLG